MRRKPSVRRVARKLARIAGTPLLMGALFAHSHLTAAETPESSIPKVELDLGSGRVRDLPLPLTRTPPALLEAKVGTPSADVPLEERDVLVGLVSSGEPKPSRWPDEDLKHALWIDGESGNLEVRVRAVARRCAPEGTHKVPLSVSYAEDASPPLVQRRLVINVHRQAPCGSIYLKGAGAFAPFLGIGLALFCTWSMWWRSRLLPFRSLSERVRLQRWVDGRGPVEDKEQVKAVKAKIREGLSRGDRARAWWASWLRRLRQSPGAAFPWGPTFKETFQIYLTRSAQGVSLSAVPEYLGPAGFANGAPPARGVLFAVASEQGGVRFFAVPDAQGRVGALQLDGSSASDPSTARVIELWGKTLLDYESAKNDPDGPAGWKIG